MRRRKFITIIAGAAAAWPVAAFAEQPPRKRPLLAYLITGTRDGLASDTSAFLNRLRDLGYIDGQNIEMVTRYADSNTARLPALADELIKLQPNVIRHSIRRQRLPLGKQRHQYRLSPPY